MRRALALAALLAGCHAAPCKTSTMFLQLDFAPSLAGATELDVVLSLDGAPEQHTAVHRTVVGQRDSLEIDVPGYTPGSQLAVRVDVIVEQVRIGSAAGQFTLAPSCTAETLALAELVCPAIGVSDPTYVDPINGSDDARYGGATGVCANRTLTFALTHAPLEIRLAAGVYQPPAEQVPFVLNGTQRLDCGGATLGGGAMYTPAGAEVTVSLAGSNRLDHCKIIGGSTSLLCVYVLGVGGGAGHVVNDCDISECPPMSGKGAGIQVDIMGDHLTVTNTRIHDTFTGIAWFGSGHAGSLVGTTFSDIRSTDIFCQDVDPAVTGSGSLHSPATACLGCQACPF